MKELKLDFTREFSVWQQEIEIEANLTTVKSELEIESSNFIFANFSDGRVAAFRIKEEAERVNENYILLADREGLADQLYKKMLPLVDIVRSDSKKFLNDIGSLKSSDLKKMRSNIISLWPGYLYGYNLYRFSEKGIFQPKNKIQKDNLEWSIKSRKYSEGIYDCIEELVNKKLEKYYWQLLDTDEVYDLVDGKQAPANRELLFVVDKSGIHQTGFESYLEENEYFYQREETENNDQIKGIVAMKGKATGKVRIVSKRNPESFISFQEGEVLVALSTSPQFVPLMKKSAAIVTSEGGMASHAAIVARELKKPCIVGTKNATKVLKDGDLVEVDANKGTVKKI
jgi:phosphohistidine swiveling domain-containing protein